VRLLRPRILRGSAPPHGPTAEVRAEFHVREHHVHEQLRHFEGTVRAFHEHAGVRQDSFHGRVLGVDDDDAVFDVYRGGGAGIPLGFGGVGTAAVGVVVVSGDVPSGGSDGDEGFDAGVVDHAQTTNRGVCEGAGHVHWTVR